MQRTMTGLLTMRMAPRQSSRSVRGWEWDTFAHPKLTHAGPVHLGSQGQAGRLGSLHQQRHHVSAFCGPEMGIAEGLFMGVPECDTTSLYNTSQARNGECSRNAHVNARMPANPAVVGCTRGYGGHTGSA